MPDLFGFMLLQEPAPSGSGGGFISLVPYLLIPVIFYFLLFRPQQKERQRVEQETKALHESLKTGDKVVTTSGILGTILAVRDDTVQLRIADGVKIDILRTSIARKQAEAAAPSEAKA
jgi:preprotein translocase subunit YajC